MSAQQLAATATGADRIALARVSALPLQLFRDEHLDRQLSRALAAEDAADPSALERARLRWERHELVSASVPAGPNAYRRAA